MKNKGITLLTLTITVIIMLILAGVTINIINNNGATEKAIRAVEETKKSAESEELQLAIFAAKDDITQIVNVEKLSTELSDWDIEKKDFYITCISPNDKAYKIHFDGTEYNEESKMIYFGNLNKFISDENAEENVLARLESVTNKKSKKIKWMTIDFDTYTELCRIDTTEEMLDLIAEKNLKGEWNEKTDGTEIFELNTKTGTFSRYWINPEPNRTKSDEIYMANGAKPGYLASDKNENENPKHLVYISEDLTTLYVLLP